MTDDQFRAELTRRHDENRAWTAMLRDPWPQQWWVVQRGYRQRFLDTSKRRSREELRGVCHALFVAMGCRSYWGCQVSRRERLTWRPDTAVRPASDAELLAHEIVREAS